jgi:hypothetical protein
MPVASTILPKSPPPFCKSITENLVSAIVAPVSGLWSMENLSSRLTVKINHFSWCVHELTSRFGDAVEPNQYAIRKDGVLFIRIEDRCH